MRVTATGPLQTIVDSLAADIRRDVAIDDRQIRWIVHSPHFGEPDAARLQSILERRVSDDAARWAFSFGIEQAEGPVRLPANERIGAAAAAVHPAAVARRAAGLPVHRRPR